MNMNPDPAAAASYSAEEWAARVDLAACYRLVDHYGMCDLIYNHVSLRVPGRDNRFLINPYGLMYEEIRASSLIEVDLDGRVHHNPDPRYSINLAGYVIHSAIHAARPDLHCIVHTHTPAGMAVSALDCGLLPVCQTAMRFKQVAYHDYEGVALDAGERDRLVSDLGDCEAMILRNHGLLAGGRTVAEAFANIYRLERACQTQLLAMACNSELRLPGKEVLARAASQLSANNAVTGPSGPRAYGALEWEALLRMLDRRDPSYKL